MKTTYTIEQVIQHTGIGRTKLYQIINAGDLKARKLGKRTIILKQDLDDFLSNLSLYQPQKGVM